MKNSFFLVGVFVFWGYPLYAMHMYALQKKSDSGDSIKNINLKIEIQSFIQQDIKMLSKKKILLQTTIQKLKKAEQENSEKKDIKLFKKNRSLRVSYEKSLEEITRQLKQLGWSEKKVPAMLDLYKNNKLPPVGVLNAPKEDFFFDDDDETEEANAEEKVCCSSKQEDNPENLLVGMALESDEFLQEIKRIIDENRLQKAFKIFKEFHAKGLVSAQNRAASELGYSSFAELNEFVLKTHRVVAFFGTYEKNNKNIFMNMKKETSYLVELFEKVKEKEKNLKEFLSILENFIKNCY